MAPQPALHNGDLLEERIGKLEQAVAANQVQIATIAKTLESVSQPTNWIAIIGTVVVTFGMMVAFVRLIADPININLGKLETEHEAFLARFNSHVEDGHPESTRILVQANKDADLERDRQNFERAREISMLNAQDIDRIRQQIARIEDELRERSSTKQTGSPK